MLSDAVILNSPNERVVSGRFSVFADFQRELRRHLATCKSSASTAANHTLDPPGVIGPETRVSVQSALACGLLKNVPAHSSAHDGAITESVWRSIMGTKPIPTLHDRVSALVLSFEDTDFGDPPEWNFCQDNKLGSGVDLNPRSADFVCYNSSDPCSFLTWGPRGATAGSGQEIQFILSMLAQKNDALLKSTFGSEYPALKRFVSLRASTDPECRDDSPVERFMCAVWMDPLRRKTWDDALTKLGNISIARETYRQLYASREFDGGTLAGYFDLWKAIGLNVNEIDYAFFVDRTTHFGGPWQEGDHIVEKLKACTRKEKRALSNNGGARRCLARLQPHQTQPEDRLARDVAFYIDDYPEGVLSENEIETWASFVPLSAESSLGLNKSEIVYLGAPKPAPVIPAPASNDDGSENLTYEERTSCPANVLAPRRRSPPN